MRNKKAQIKIQVPQAKKTKSFLAPKNSKNFLGNRRFIELVFSRKAQIKIQEMAFVLVALLVVFGIGILLFFRFQSGAWGQAAEEVRERRTISLLDKVSAMPELKCGSSLTKQSGCIDEIKLQFMQGEFATKYKRTWKDVLRIEVERLYPQEEPLIYVLYEDTKFNNPKISFTSYSNIISLCKYSQKGYVCDIARLAIYMEEANK